VSAFLTASIFASAVVPTEAIASPYTAAHKFRRGVSNMALGVLAIPGQMTVLSREKGYAVGLPLGFVQGIGWMVVTEAVGVWEFLTCPFEFPPQFRPLITPEYPWSYFERRGKGAGFPRKRGAATPGR
jgi:putative exosortase-associated protein (TIGR04073 family)